MRQSFRAPGPVDTNSLVRRLGFRCPRSNSGLLALRPPPCPSFGRDSAPVRHPLRLVQDAGSQRCDVCPPSPQIAVPRTIERLRSRDGLSANRGNMAARRHPSLGIVSHRRARFTRPARLPSPERSLPRAAGGTLIAMGPPRHGLNGIPDRPCRDPQRGAVSVVE